MNGKPPLDPKMRKLVTLAGDCSIPLKYIARIIGVSMPTLLSWKSRGVPKFYAEYVTEFISLLTQHKENKVPTDAESLRWYGFISLIDLYYLGDNSNIAKFITKE